MNVDVDSSVVLRVVLRVVLGEPKRLRYRSCITTAMSSELITVQCPRTIDPRQMLGSLDAIHLASALLTRGSFDELSLASHDRDLATAARAEGFRVLGT